MMHRFLSAWLWVLSLLIACFLLTFPARADVKVDVDVKADSVLDAIEAQMPDFFNEEFCTLGGDTQPDCATSAIHMAKTMVKMSGIAKGAWDSFKLTIDIAQDVADLYGFGMASFGAEMVMNALDSASPEDFLKNSGQTLVKSITGAAASAGASRTLKWEEVLDESFTDEAVNTLGEKFLSKAAGKLYEKILEDVETGVTDRTYGAGFWGSGILNLLDIPDPTTHPCGPVTMTFWISRGGDTGLQYNMSISGDCKCESGRPVKMRAFNVYVTIPLQRTLKVEDDTVKMEVRPAGRGRYHATADCNCDKPAEDSGTGLMPDDEGSGGIGFVPSDGFTTADYICIYQRGCLQDRQQYEFHKEQAERAQARADAERAKAEQHRTEAERLRQQAADDEKAYNDAKARLDALTPPTDANLEAHGASLKDYYAAQDAVRNFEQQGGRRDGDKLRQEASQKDASAVAAEGWAREYQAKANSHQAQANYFWAKYQDCLRRCIRDACAVGDTFGTGRSRDMIWTPGYGAQQVQKDMHELIEKMKKEEGLRCKPFGLGARNDSFGFIPSTMTHAIAYTPADFGALQIASDSPNWCESRPGNPTPTPIGPGGDEPGSTPGDDPGDQPGGGQPGDGPGSQPGDTPGSQPGDKPGDDPRDGPGLQPGDDPRDLPGGGGDDPRDAKQPCERWIENLLTHRDDLTAQLEKLINTKGSSEELIENLAQQIRQIDEEVAHRRQDCPEGGTPDDGDDPRDLPSGLPTPTATDDGDDPRDSTTDDGDDPRDAPTVPVVVKAKRQVLTGEGTQVAEAVAGENIKLAMPSQLASAVPGPGIPKDTDTDHDEDPVQGRTDANGDLVLDVPVSVLSKEAKQWLKDGCGSLKCALDSAKKYTAKGVKSPILQTDIDVTTQASTNLKLAGGKNDPVVKDVMKKFEGYVSDVNTIGQNTFVTLTYAKNAEGKVLGMIKQTENIIGTETNYCRIKEQAPNDPLYNGKGAWGQDFDNQWALKRVGLTPDKDSAWNLLGKNPSPVVVAVIDTGLDWNHLDFDWKNLWRNPKEIPGNGKDDDNNGYVDDVIGWDFFENDNTPWDLDGHGTITAGIIAAHTGNGVGMAGINPHARIMVLRALNSFGNTRASYLAKAIVYAVDNGARIINMSVGGPEISEMETAAVAYAESKGVLIVAAAGNQGQKVDNYGIAANDNVVTVAATDQNDKRAVFSNWGSDVDIAAPGVDILGLRARRTDTMRDMEGVDYKPGDAYVGDDKRYYRAGGTSFAAPIVTGVASLILSKNPDLTVSQLRNILLQSARDIETPGKDNLTGYGLVDARAALSVDPAFFILAEITGVSIVEDKGKVALAVQGSADAHKFKSATLAIGAGENPTSWKDTGVTLRQPVKAGELGRIDAGMFAGSAVWIVRLTVEDAGGRQRVFWYKLNIG